MPIAPDPSTREPVACPVEGHREWNVAECDGVWVLVGIGVPLPWLSDAHGVSRAACAVGEGHPAPQVSCRCGFHLLAGPPPDGGAIVRGRATGWGVLVEHEHGWRCRWARPVRLRLSCDRLSRAFPGAAPEAVAEQLAARYRCAVELVGERREQSPSATLRPSSVLALVVAGAGPGLLAQGGALALAGAGCLLAGLATLALLAVCRRERARGRRHPRSPEPVSGKARRRASATTRRTTR